MTDVTAGIMPPEAPRRTLMDTALLPECQRVVPALLLCLLTCFVATHARWWSCGRSCSRCVRQVMPMEELIGQFYPGLFSLTPPAAGSPTLSSKTAVFGSSMVNSASAEIPNALRSSNSVDKNYAEHFSDANNSLRHEDHSGGSESFRMTPLAHLRSPFLECCETITEYVTPPNVTIQGKTYRVVHLSRAFQFIPIGRCRPGSICSYGECVDQFRAHWILVYNHTDTSMGPPVSFSPIEVPSHCECINVGRS
ncbi:hypothetical protein EGW08_020241 [Elysia chlorotica]|uniref:Spaetzle domain-containing protein n=1 Tax=Elysia chlorotica TaxID=188477 RepID=A0A3S0Z6W3_ELYCH|nr:hypothetical protein EGW08_020241 [Elysia chlorotica]